jgi:hypothetical protein
MTRLKHPAEARTPPAGMDAAGHPLPAFEPVPRKFRHDGWTPARQQAFIAALAASGNVTAACAHVGMTAVGAYYLRRQPGAESFARAWAAALDGGTAPPDQFPAPEPLSLRGLMHILEAQARRRREAAAEAGLTVEEIDDANAALIEGFQPVQVTLPEIEEGDWQGLGDA